ncbi:MAG: hypothetical protein NUV55_00315 [Sulfuricaulis sp.]|uniref:DUF4912 domain-containing protein n=1 Tax=Sulfuricaulis sp. TaxID=2003553 RepID=UPI0025DD1B99|nr:hypothetical protein [Sulfuricaulis sp.]MCR4345641.1 hypothetical protein [Sulfuricaulis sp.]
MTDIRQSDFFLNTKSSSVKLDTSSKNLKELRALARSRGLRGYSKLSHSELEKLLSRPNGHKPVVAGISVKAAPKKTKSAVRAKSRSTAPNATARTKKKQPTIPAGHPAAHVASETQSLAPKWEWATDTQRQYADEEQVESAKYAIVPPGVTAPRVEMADLNENIDDLPPVNEPMLCLLPQKPGVLHGYWIMPPGAMPNPQALKLRLGRIARETFEVIDEITLPHERGHWYFHVDEAADMGAVFLLLGYYEPGGRFVSVNRRGIARIPNLYASDRTDRLWWVSEEQFRTMYRRAGGYVRGPHLGWAASISSPGGAPSSDHLAKPGNVSSR